MRRTTGQALGPALGPALALILLCFANGCSIGRPELLSQAPPLFDMEEPLELRAEPDDESAREALPSGSFTGIHAADRARSLDAMLEGGEGVLVERVVENSPADVAGVLPGDIVLEADVAGGTDTKPVILRWPSEWRALELAAAPGTKIALRIDRAAKEMDVELTTSPRARAPDRAAAERFREEDKVGIVVRTATEVEARAAGLGPGGGAVVVGLSRSSPWREVKGEDAHAGLVFGDLVARADGADIAHPQVLIDAIRAKERSSRMKLEIWRGPEHRTLELPVSARDRETREVSIPLLYSYTNDRGKSETSVLFGLYKHEKTKAAWRTRLLWLISFGRGDSDRLEEERS